MPEAAMKPDQERVKNLLTDTVTLLCKNGLSFSVKLRIEGLLGVSIDDNDLFFVHISENIYQNPPDPPLEEESAESPVFTAPESPAKNTRQPHQSPSPSRLVKPEPGDDPDELLIVEEPKPELLERARVVAGQRRAQRRERSPSQQHGWEDTGEPAAKRHMSAEEDENGGSYADQGGGGGWPDLSAVGGDYNQDQVYQQDPGGADFDTTTPGCSTWPTTLATQPQTQDSMANPGSTDPGPRFPQANSSKRVRDALWETIVRPMTENPISRIMAFRLVWSRKDIIEEDVWAGMAQYRQHMDRMMATVQGPSLFISSISANVSHQGKFQNVIPCLGYFVLVDDPSFIESHLYIPMRENPFGAVLKLMNLPATEKEDRRLGMLSKLVKDYGEGYVRRRMDLYHAERPEPLVIAYIRDKTYMHSMAAAAAVLRSNVGLYMELKDY